MHSGWPTPPPPKKKSAAPAIIVSVVLLLLLGTATVGVIALVRENDDAGSSRSASRSNAPAADEEEPTSTTKPAPLPRVPVDAGGGVGWTMSGFPQKEPIRVPAPDGSTMQVMYWVSEDSSMGAGSGEIGMVFELEGRSYDLEAGLNGAVAGNRGVVVEGPTRVTVAGRPGLMVTSTFEQSGFSGIARYAAARFGDRIVLVGIITAGDDRSIGQQRFADIVASVHG